MALLLLSLVSWVSWISSQNSAYPPEQVHLAWTDEDTSMSVTWASNFPTLGAVVQFTPVNSHTSKVAYYSFSSPGTWTTFPNSADPSILQRYLYVCKAYMTGLKLGGLYAYRVGSDTYGWSKEYVFQAKRNFTSDPLARLLVYADFGIGEQIVATVSRLKLETDTYKYDAVIHNGDFAYDLNTNMGEYGDTFLNSLEPIASQIPYMVSQGNHENDLVLPHYINRFQMPGNASNLWYSFNLGKAHFVAFNTELVYEGLNQTQELQMQFLKNDLASVDRVKYPWVIVYGHRPLYCSPNMTTQKLSAVPLIRKNIDCIDRAQYVRGIFEDVWYNNSVDLVIGGHVHAYERLGSVYQNKSIPCTTQNFNLCQGAKAPIYVVTGVPGQDNFYSPSSPTPLPFSMFQDDHLGYSRLTIFNETHLLFEQVRSESGEVVDYLFLVK